MAAPVQCLHGASHMQRGAQAVPCFGLIAADAVRDWLPAVLTQRLTWLQGSIGGSWLALLFFRLSPAQIALRFRYDSDINGDMKDRFSPTDRKWSDDKRRLWIFPSHLEEEVKGWARNHFAEEDIVLLPEVG